MIHLKINNQAIEVPEGTTLLEAARKLGIEIPTMCHLEGTEHFTSCMVCLVKDARHGRLVASCSMPAMEGMEIITDDDECRESRKMSLELLLSEHVGDCEAPCQSVCPAHMNIPLMNRLIAAGKHQKAIEVVKRDIALPAILGRICPAPCEAGCRRKPIDEAVSICLLKGFVADHEIQKEIPLPADSGRKVAIVGAGPAGLAAAFYLSKAGHAVTLFEKNALAGGALLEIADSVLPKEVREKEINSLLNSKIHAEFNVEISAERFIQLQQDFDAAILATGALKDDFKDWELKLSKSGIEVDKKTYQTSLSKVFAIGNALRPSKLAVRSVGQGKDLAFILNNWFETGELHALPERFNSKFGKLLETEYDSYLKESNHKARQIAGRGKAIGFTAEEAETEASRCLHCDCRNPESCKLRDLANQFGAEQKRFQYDQRIQIQKEFAAGTVVFEPGKCIKCGICVRLTKQHQEEFGFSFIGRGFDVRIGVPFSKSVGKALAKTAVLVATKCPTGALALIDSEEQID
ncbi:FAD-dependent oxidoreductase [Mangrovibacterium diazotrophicum]|uniref:Putative NAD(P)-binding protein n=1 Tax=Mangrovibacterium diazotrophicum TaxID=1261403 RepID=A0A419W3S9_9BACT|nr:FAD-dependent oxidoreductase [Mangrovibacterium diazotrophicum]RKD89970.1 putative NAD(P)-binding protein [Mangrovibacterium diazotrophicum]